MAICNLRFFGPDKIGVGELSLNPKGDGTRTSFYVHIDSESGRLRCVESAPGEEGGIIAAIHIEPSGSHFLESLEPSIPLYISRGTISRRQIPASAPSKERILVLLDDNMYIHFNETTIFFESSEAATTTASNPPGGKNAPAPSDADIDASVGNNNEGEGPQIQVVQSMQDDSYSGGSRPPGMSFRDETPIVPDTLQEEPKVAETPTIRSRHIDPNTSPRERRIRDPRQTFSSPKAGSTRLFASSVSVPKLKATEVDLAVDDGDVTASDDEGPTRSSYFTTVEQEPRPASSDGVAATPEAGLVLTSKSAAPVADMGVASSSITGARSRIFGSSPQNLKPRTSSNDQPPGSATPPISSSMMDVEDPKLPDSLPEAFRYEKHKKAMTPRKTYSRKPSRTSRTPVQKKLEIEESSAAKPIYRNQSQEPEPEPEPEPEALFISSAPLTAATEKSRKRKMPASDNDLLSPSEILKGGDVVMGKRRKASIEAESFGGGEDDTSEVEERLVKRSKERQRRRRVVESELESSIVQPTPDSRGFPDLFDTAKVDIKKNTKTLKKPWKKTAAEEKGSSEIGLPEETTPSDKPTQAKPARKAAARKRKSTTTEPEEETVTQLPQSKEHESEPKALAKPKRGRQFSGVKAAPKRKSTASQVAEDDTNPGETQYTALDETQQLVPKTLKATASKRRNTKTPTTTRKAPVRKRKSDITEASQDGEEIEGETSKEELDTRTAEKWQQKNPGVVFSNSTLDTKKDILTFLRAHGAKKLEHVQSADILIVGPGELKRTPKLTISVALGKYVVEEQWLLDSKAAGYFLDPEKYIPIDTPNIDLPAAITRGRNGENAVLKDWTVYITPALLSQLKSSGQEESLVEMVKAAGAVNVVKKAPRGDVEERTLVLSAEKGDGDAGVLERGGWAVYSTGVVGGSVLKGRLEVGGEEWKVKIEEAKEEVKTKGRRGRTK